MGPDASEVARRVRSATVDERTFGVAELAGVLGRVVAQAFPGDAWVRGQIRNLSRSAKGHVYFDLAEPGPLGANPIALVPVALLAGEKPAVNTVMKAAGAGRIDEGVEVRIRGRLTWYTPRGQLQMRMNGIDPTYTLGRLVEDRDRLLGDLRRDGLLGRNRTRALPVLPLRVGLVTSVGSAAAADFLHELEVAGYGFRVLVADARTSGLDAGRSVAAAIGAVVAAGAEVVALVRGGGSRTELGSFDGEAIARAVALAPVPVLTGIGHEVDRSVADEVAHTAYKTPTACAAGLVSQVALAMEEAEARWAAITGKAAERLAGAEDRLRRTATRAAQATVVGLAGGEHALTGAERRLRREPARALDDAERRLAASAARARAFDPALALARGWSITRRADGTLVRVPHDVTADDDLVTTLAGGTVRSRVTG